MKKGIMKSLIRLKRKISRHPYRTEFEHCRNFPLLGLQIVISAMYRSLLVFLTFLKIIAFIQNEIKTFIVMLLTLSQEGDFSFDCLNVQNMV
jgi:hypothetical protein